MYNILVTSRTNLIHITGNPTSKILTRTITQGNLSTKLNGVYWKVVEVLEIAYSSSSATNYKNNNKI